MFRLSHHQVSSRVSSRLEVASELNSRSTLYLMMKVLEVSPSAWISTRARSAVSLLQATKESCLSFFLVFSLQCWITWMVNKHQVCGPYGSVIMQVVMTDTSK